MRYIARLSVTFRLIRHALSPAVALDHLPVIPACLDLPWITSPDVLFFLFRSSGLFLGFADGCTFFVPGAFSLAAPFVLFRLKRWGYSGCRVSANPEGLRIEARR